MKENKNVKKIKVFAKKKRDNFTDWFKDKEHPRSRLNKNVFFHDSLKLIGLILVFLIINSNLERLNNIILILIKLGSTLQLVLAFFIIKKAIHIIKNLKYAYRGLNNGTKAIISITIVLLLFFVFVNQEVVIDSITKTYDETNFSRLNPIQVSGNFSLLNLDKNSSKLTSLSYEDPLISKCKSSFNSCKDVSTQKYDMTVSLIKAEKFSDVSNAEEFYNAWKDPLQMSLEWELTSFSYDKKAEDYLPIVLLASKVKGSEGQIPIVLICDSNGELTKYSKSQLLCG